MKRNRVNVSMKGMYICFEGRCCCCAYTRQTPLPGVALP